MKSFGILRTHTGLSSNTKVVIDSNYNLFIETIDSQDELSADKFKKIQFNKNNYYDELVPFLFKDLPTDIAFSIKYENDNFNMSNDFAKQYDDLYLAGARNIIENKSYEEEFEYFAPLYIFKHNIPKYFIIFRVDGPGLLNLTKDNFRQEFLDKFKTVKLFDLTKASPLGEWIETNFSKNPSFPVAPLEVDFRELEFTRWIGIDYESGGYTSKPFYLDENLENENTLFDFEKFFLDGYKVNKVVFPHILNFTYLFDDEPATKETLRKWSLNRYAGFYLEDIDLIDSVTPFVMPRLHTDVVIESGNIIKSNSFDDPFVEGFKDDNNMWVEYLGEFYQVIKFEEESTTSLVRRKVNDKRKRLTIEEVKKPLITKYKIVSDLNLEGEENLLNQRSCYINSNNELVQVSNNSPYLITDFGYADVNLIEINGVYHNLVQDGLTIRLNTDYGFKFSENNRFTYYTNSEKEGYTFSWDLLITKNNSPRNWKIYRLRFADVKDFDTNIIDTEFARFEYEKRDDLTKTEEPKMYLTDLRSKSLPQDFDDFIFKGKTELVPVASDYTANLETFRIEGNKLTDLWRKNPIYCRWGYQNSLSAFDYKYYLNNNDVHGDWNLTVNCQNSIPKRSDRNLDYFYTINSGTTSYLYHSLHVEKNFGTYQDTSYHFELDKYLELGSYSQLGTTYSYEFDYFDIFFSQTASFLDGELIQNRKKYSYFEAGDRVIPNTTVFRGLKFKLFEVDNIKSNKVNIENINLFSSNKFQDYSFSILLSSNDWMISDENQLYKPYEWDYFIDEQNELTNLALVSGFSGTPSNIQIGDIIEIDQFPIYDNFVYQQQPLSVQDVGLLTLGGYGITLNYPFSSNNDVVEGIWRNKMQWQVIKEWEWDTQYLDGDLVLYEGQIFEVLNGATVSDPNQNPFTLSSNYAPNSPNPLTIPDFQQLWSNVYDYGSNNIEWVYHFDEYYVLSNTSSNVNFWNPNISLSGYATNSIVNYQNRYFEAITNVPVGIRPVVQNRKIQSASGTKYWSEVPKPTQVYWEKVQIWDRNQTSYPIDTYVVYDDILYKSLTDSTVDDIPGENNLVWERIYSIVPDTEYVYGPNDNSIIKINDSLYYCKYNPGLTLDNGITIYINKKWKNVLVNIAINDNTIQSNHPTIMDETRNLERDFLYVETNGRLTAANFIKQINDLENLYGFADFTSYVIIEEDGSFKKYNFKNKLSELPYFLVCEEPDEFELRDDTLRYSINTVDKNTLKPQRFLNDGNIDNLEKIDFYNEVPLGTNIENVKGEPSTSINYNSQTNLISNTLHRHSGYYMPIFYEVELFNNAGIYDSGSLCEIQFIVWLGTASGTQSENITLNISDNENSISIDTDLVLPNDDSEVEIEDYYQQIIDIINEQDFLNETDISFDLLQPGDPNIHPNIVENYWVLSMKYDRENCDIRVSATSETACTFILQYFFEENNWNAESILSSLDTGGIIISEEEANLCCPECGPQLLGFLQHSPSGTQSFKELYDEYVGGEPNCLVMATASSTSTWDNFTNWYSYSISNNSEFDSVYNSLSAFQSNLTDFYGIGQYGEPNLLTRFISLITGVDDENSVFEGILSRGLYINCEGGNYVVKSMPPETPIIEFQSICLLYIIDVPDQQTFNSRNEFIYDDDNNWYYGTINGLDYYLIENNGTWELRIQTPEGDIVTQNNELVGDYNSVSNPGWNEYYSVDTGFCRELDPVLKGGFCLNFYDSESKTYKKILMEYNPVTNTYLGYEQMKNGFIRVWEVILISGVWTLIYTEQTTQTPPSVAYGPNSNPPNGAEMNDYLPIPLSNNWTEYSITGAFDEENLEVLTNVCRNDNSCCDPLCLTITFGEYTGSFILSPVTDEDGDLVYYLGHIVDHNGTSIRIKLKFNGTIWEAFNYDTNDILFESISDSVFGGYNAQELTGYRIQMSSGYCNFTDELKLPSKIYKEQTSSTETGGQILTLPTIPGL